MDKATKREILAAYDRYKLAREQGPALHFMDVSDAFYVLLSRRGAADWIAEMLRASLQDAGEGA